MKYKNENEVTIRDLKKLGKEGGAAALLITGETLYLKPKYATIKRKIKIGEKETIGEVIIYYPNVYRQIISIFRKHILIARKTKFCGQSILLLTGKGYTRKKEVGKK